MQNKKALNYIKNNLENFSPYDIAEKLKNKFSVKNQVFEPYGIEVTFIDDSIIYINSNCCYCID